MVSKQTDTTNEDNNKPCLTREVTFFCSPVQHMVHMTVSLKQRQTSWHLWILIPSLVTACQRKLALLTLKFSWMGNLRLRYQYTCYPETPSPQQVSSGDAQHMSMIYPQACSVPTGSGKALPPLVTGRLPYTKETFCPTYGAR